MARFFGEIGYANSIEVPADSGLWVDDILEYSYHGDIIRNASQNVGSEYLNSDITVNNSISIIADKYAFDNFTSIKYVRWEGVAWDVTNIEVRPPRIILNLGSVYAGPFPVIYEFDGGLPINIDPITSIYDCGGVKRIIYGN